MQYIDIIILTIILLSFVIGLYRGFVKEVLSLAILISAVAVPFYFGRYLLDLVSEYVSGVEIPFLSGLGIDLEMVVFAMIFIVLFIVIIVVGHILTTALSRAINESPLNFFNRLLGSAFGIIRGGIVVILLIIFLSVLQYPLHGNSKILPFFVDNARYAVSLLPYQYSRNFRFEYEESKPIEDIEQDNEPYQNDEHQI